MQEKIEIRYHERFQSWLEGLRDDTAVLKIRTRIDLMTLGSFGDTRTIHKGVAEAKIDYGPGYRIYFGRKGSKLVVLLAGSQKKNQQKTINEVHKIWADVKKQL